jgi:hypothetical protein
MQIGLLRPLNTVSLRKKHEFVAKGYATSTSGAKNGRFKTNRSRKTKQTKHATYED